MRTVLLDKNINDKRFAKRCNSEGVVDCRRLPKALYDAEDDVVLRHVAEQEHLLVTCDHSIATEHCDALPSRFPGILIVRLDDDAVHTITSQRAQKVLADFKSAFPCWSDVPWSNSILELKPAYLRIYHVEGRNLLDTGFVDRNSKDWQSELVRWLESNATRHLGRP